MEYTISEIAKMMGVSTHTLRYYDKEVPKQYKKSYKTIINS